MTIEEALAVLDDVLGQITLSDTQELVFRHTWEDWTYERIAEQFGYTTDYVKNVGSQLWEHLSQLLGVKVNKKNVQSVLRRWAQQHCPPEAVRLGQLRSPRQDLGEAPDVSSFAGRQEELALLHEWIIDQQCRLVALLGMGGMGKTSLAAIVAEQIGGQFEAVVWRSLRNAPPVEELIGSLIQFLSNGEETEATLPGERHGRISRLIDRLRTNRCLVILDNAESVLSSEFSQRSSSSDTGYAELCDRLCDLPHRSCIVLTSREKPDAIAWKEGMTLPVRSLQLSGLSDTDAQQIFRLKGTFLASDAEWRTLTQHYAGNPLALKMVAAAIQELFNGDVSQFLSILGTLVFDDIRDLLDRQFGRLSDVEKDVMYWLAINREVCSFTELRDDILCPIARQKLPSVLRSLKHRFLIETSPDGFTQQPVVMEYVTQQLIEQVAREISTFQPVSFSPHPPALSSQSAAPLLQTHALLKATAKDYIRDSQARLILAPLVERLVGALRSYTAPEERCRELLAQWQTVPQMLPGYGAGNMVNLLRYLQADLTQLNLSHLTIRQAHLQGMDLHQTNLTNAEIVRSVFLESLGNVWSVVFSPDGALLAAGDSVGEIHLWRVADGQKRLTLQGHTNWVCAIAFSPDGTRLISGGADNEARIWNLTTGECLKILPEAEWILAVAFSPNGIVATGGADRTIKLWQSESGALLKTLEGHKNWVGAIAFSPTATEKILASGSDDFTIKLWDQQGACHQTLAGHTGHVRSVAFNADGSRLISGSSDHTLKLWDTTSGQCLQTFTGHTHAVRSVAYTGLEDDGLEDNRPENDGLENDRSKVVVSASEDNTLRMWDAATGECLKVLHGHTGHVRSIASSPDGQLLASGSADQTVKLWRHGHCLRTLQGYTNGVLSVACASSVTGNGTIAPVVASGCSDRTIRLWNLHTGRCLNTLKGHTHSVWSVAFSPDGCTLVSSSIDRTLRLWQVGTGECLHVLQGHTDWLHAIAFSPDGCTLASSSSDQTVRLWQVQTGECLNVFAGHSSHVWSVAFSPDGQTLASSSDDQTVKLWDVQTGACLQTLRGHTRRVQAIAFSPDGAWLASGSSDQTIGLWEVQTGQRLSTILNGSDHLKSLTFSPIESPFFQRTEQLLLCSHAGSRVNLWNASTGECVHRLEGHHDRVWSIAFSPDGQTLISGSEDGTVRLWDVERGRCLHVLRSPRPYEGMIITGIKGLTAAQIATLKSLGAVE